jgi:hypothetical protein
MDKGIRFGTGGGHQEEKQEERTRFGNGGPSSPSRSSGATNWTGGAAAEERGVRLGNPNRSIVPVGFYIALNQTLRRMGRRLGCSYGACPVSRAHVGWTRMQ